MNDRATSSPAPLRILHVEDDPAHAELVRRAFEEHPVANRITWVQSAREALEILLDPEAPRPDVLLLDLRLPGDDGLEVLRRVRATPPLESLPVAVLTSSEAEPDRLHPFAGSLDGYLVKPLDLAGFSALLDELVRLVRRRRDAEASE